MVAQVPVCFDIAEQGYWLDAQLGRECRNGSVSVGLGSLGQADLSLCQCELAPAFSTTCTSCGKASHGPFPDQVWLELSQGRKDAEEHRTCRGGGVIFSILFTEHTQANATICQVAHRIDQMRQGATEPVQFPDD